MREADLDELIERIPALSSSGYEFRLQYAKADRGKPARWIAGYFSNNSSPFCTSGETRRKACILLLEALKREATMKNG